MRLVVASGKGGTGKTTVATALAQTAALTYAVRLLDCDVEAPNAALSLHPQWSSAVTVTRPVPRVDATRCTACGRCAEVCQFNALAVVGGGVLVFDDLCHGCGRCVWICPEQAMHEEPLAVGQIDAGYTPDGILLAQGLLRIGQPMGMPVLRALKRWPTAAALDAPFSDAESAHTLLEIRDAPPGASCPVVETLRGADAVILVTEPTAFGLHDLRQVVGIVQELGLPAWVVINRDGIGTAPIAEYCAEQGLPIALRIPLERRLAEALARGRPLLDAAPEYRPAVQTLLEQIVSGVAA
ncbi:MinD superfamily P-loop ATPase, contains an inserted ferredoxin domain [Allochromatium warmingii]|uniref:MinD superfamily P-loop ATPase, contains an inserted ferredoxin domain n=1 Tax=Allochromatium warmingii TaxID=61595 RepID=A0A1H3CMD0_ALLWA|nr:ATP-binding protein [Allochromatium warmingii]SDX54754.1 MinD superfamily P-loop ATPase, contains an inserted ferredoxin domain [Allochromatium warmingii]